MKILAIETSCDETAAAVVEDGRKVLSSVVLSQVKEHRLYGGVVPEIASRRHCESICQVTKSALEEAALSFEDIDAVGVTYAPGLVGALLVGVNYAKSLAYALQKPCIPVHHLRSHIAANYLAFQELTPPFLALVVSGGHTHLALAKDFTDFKVLGRTRDDAAGEAFDKVARTMGMEYPGGIALDKAAQRGNSEKYILPIPKVENPLDFSFSGLKTAVINRVHKAEQKNEPFRKEDMAASFQKTICKILVEKTLMAAEKTNSKTAVLAGGVSANSQLRREMKSACDRAGLKLYFPPLNLCSDNAAMVGSQAFYEFKAGRIGGLNLNAIATLSLEEGE